MKTLKEKQPIVLALAIIGVCALVYGVWTIYYQHMAEQKAQAIIMGTPSPGFRGLNEPSTQPPPQ